MPIYLPQPELEVDPYSGLRRPGILAGHQAFVEGVFPVVAHRPGGIENTASASGTVVAGGWESGNRSGAGLAPGEPVKTPKESAPRDLRSSFRFAILGNRCQSRGAIEAELLPLRMSFSF